MKHFKTVALGILFLLVFLFATISAWIYSRIDNALPQLEGKITLFGLAETTEVTRDENGVVTISAKKRADAAMALGFVHAQERFFQMDLLRRNSAGELSSLFGERALDYDKSIRIHRFRERARTIVRSLSDQEFSLLKAYTRGVNQGLEYLGVTPIEYLLLQQEPVPWQEEDSILTIFSMYLDLQYSKGERELTLGAMKSALPKQVYNFLNPKGSRWDAAIDGSEYAPSPMPTAAWPTAGLASNVSQPPQQHTVQNKQNDQNALLADLGLLKQHHGEIGSNNWSVAGEISQTKSAIIANDMHLGLRVPNIWFRAQLNIEENDQDKARTITGATLPGTPMVVIGSNSHIAWGFTNSYGDWSDVIVLKTTPDKKQYLTPDGYLEFTISHQMMAIKDKESVEFEVKDTIWGPVIGENNKGELLVYRWVAHDVNAVNLVPVNLETATTVEQAFEIAAASGIPAQNFIVGDRHGDIGWTIMGPIPNKVGQVGDVPTDWSTGENKWQGYLSPSEYPKIKSPNSDRLWTANSRVVGGKMLEKIGNGGYALGARSQQIRSGLFAKQKFNEQDLLNIALDTEAKFLTRWHKLLVDTVFTDQAVIENRHWQEAQSILLSNKPLAADVDSVSYRIVRNFRVQVQDIVFSQLVENLEKYEQGFDFKTIRNQLEVPLWQLVSNQATNYLWLGYDSWQEIFTLALNNTLTNMTAEQPLSAATWGQENSAKIHHPLSSAIPFFGKFLNMPPDQLPGDSFIPRVDGAGFGASERMVVSPGHEESGIFHMPSSQSSHPWSPYFGKGHQDWVQGKPSPFLPGETKYRLTLLSY